MIAAGKNIISRISGVLSACVMPVLPLIIAGSVFKLVHLLMGLAGVADGSTGELIRIIGDVPFYFMPVPVSYYAAKHFQTAPLYAIGAACVLLAPDFMALMTGTEAVSFLGIPVVRNSYAYQILPVILTVFVLSKIAGPLERRFPSALKGPLYSFVLFAITVALEIVVLAPLGFFIGSGLSAVLAFCSAHASVPAWGVFAAILALLVPTGLHWIFVTTVFNDLAAYGHDSGIMASFLIMGMALAGADFAYALRSGRTEDRTAYAFYGISVLLTGVSEPSLYAMALRDARAMRAVMIASLLTGMYQGLVHIPCYIYSFPAIPSVLMFYSPDHPGNLRNAVIVIIAAIVLGFILTFLSCKDPLPAQDGQQR